MTSPETSISHRCDKWVDKRIHPESDWLWGTKLEYVPQPLKRADGTFTTPFWMLFDETSETYSIWGGLDCPFCGVVLKSLLP